MKRAFQAVLVLSVVLFCISAFAGEWVNGYTKSNGTYVKGYYRSSPNSTVTDNYSYHGNVNPYTGKTGTNYYRHNSSSPYYSPGLTSGKRSTYSNSYDSGSSSSGLNLSPYRSKSNGRSNSFGSSYGSGDDE